MKKVLSVLLSVMLFMMMFQGIQIFAAVDNSYAYVLSEQTPNYNDVTATVSEDGAYVSLVTTGDDSWFALDGLNIPSEYKILAIKYAGISTTNFEMYANSTLGDVSGTRFAMFNLMAETDAGEVFKALSADTTDPVDPPKPPVTGDSSIYLTVAALVVVSAAGVILYRKKKAAL